MKRFVSFTIMVLSIASSALAAGDPGAGEKVFNKCKVCHSIGEGAKNKIGPELNGVIGRKAASAPDYSSYGEGLKDMAAKGLVWDEASLTQYLHNPKAFNSTTRMGFAGLSKDEDVADVIAYLSLFDADGKRK